MKRFKLFNQEYELVAIAKDQSRSNMGKIAIYRIPSTQEYFTMPISELSSIVNRKTTEHNSSVNWNERIELYKERFIGRTDVYANRYFNKRLNKKMYSPAVPFENGLPMRNHFLKLNDAIILKHLQQDKLAIGIYPLDEDNLTKFLAFDLDGHHQDQLWKELTVSLKKVCVKNHLYPLIEISQSGKGCHVWLFFQEPIAAKVARQLGDFLLKSTQEIDSRLPFTAFDRFFPAQDTIGDGKVGNLIAAPLEGQAVEHGKTTFVDESWKAFSNPWQVLKNVDLISLKRVQDIINKNNVSLDIGDKSERQTDIFTNNFHIPNLFIEK